MNNKIILKVVSGLTLLSMIGYTLPVFAYTKDETVYSKLDSNGKAYKTIVSTHIKNTENEEVIKDVSDLLNIKNTSGDETFTQDGNTFTWNTNKNDIYYQGESQKELPIECNVKYELDGKEISSEEIGGKSGHVKITLQYTNKEEKYVYVNGKQVKMYVPFVVLAGTILDNEDNKNITVSNGKVVNDGTKALVAGIAMPGLQESLGISKSEMEIPSTIEIEMDTTKFETKSIVSCVTPKVLEKEDLNIFDNLDKIYGQVNTLQESSKKIEDGANALKDGAATYSEKSQEFNSAMNQVTEGTNTLNTNYAKIDNGTKSIKDGATKLNAGVSTLSSGVEKLNTGVSGAKTKISAGLTTAATQMGTNLDALSAGVNQAIVGTNPSDSEVKSIKEIVESANDKMETKLNENLETNVNATTKELIKVAIQAANPSLPETQIEEIINGMNSSIEANNKTAIERTTSAVISTVETTELGGVNQVATGMNTTLQGAKTQITAAITSQGEEIVSGLSEIEQGTASLKTSVNNQLLTGTQELEKGAQQLSTGSTQVKDGISTLNNGAQQLNAASGKLTEGAATLSEGATTLAEGITKFNEEGIKKICDYINGDIKDVANRAEKLTELSKEYNNFTMLNKDDEGEVKFIMIIDGVKAKADSEQDKEKAVVEGNNTNTTSEKSEEDKD